MSAEPCSEEYYPLPPRSVVGWIYRKEGMGKGKLYIIKMYATGQFFCFFTLKNLKTNGQGF